MLFDKFYVCHFDKIDDSGKAVKTIFKEPVLIDRVAIAPTSGDTEIKVYGERVSKMFTITLNREMAKPFNEGDLVYYDTEPPTIEVEIPSEIEGEEPTYETKYYEPYGSNANYKVVSVRPYNVKSVIIIEKLP